MWLITAFTIALAGPDHRHWLVFGASGFLSLLTVAFPSESTVHRFQEHGIDPRTAAPYFFLITFLYGVVVLEIFSWLGSYGLR